jgi:hypothetical protein
MATINELKELDLTETPLLLFECTLSSGLVERWSTQAVELEGQQYAARVLRHDLFEIRAGFEDGIDALAKISIWLANADSRFSEIERSVGWKGARVTARFAFFDLRQGTAASEAVTLLRGIADSPDEITESTLRLTVMNSLNLQRVWLPEARVERRCPWKFPTGTQQRTEAAQGGGEGKHSPFYRCGYSADRPDGAGNLDGETPYAACDRTRAQCQARGMFDQDSAERATRRFGGIEFVPPATLVRSYGEKGRHVSEPVENRARYNDFVPLIYGTVWYAPLIVFSKNDGNLTRMEVLLGMGEIESVLKVLVNDVDIPLGQAGRDMTATGWFNMITAGGRTGGFNPDYLDASGNPLGDPYGSMAALSVVVPNRISDGRGLPDIQVLLEGLKLEQFDATGATLGESFTGNPAWAALDVLRRCGWKLGDIDAASFARAAANCDELITARDLNGNLIDIPRFQCSLVLRRRRTAADAIRGVRNAARLFLTYGTSGRLEMRVEDTLARQQAVKPAGSNATSTVNGGWPAYEFGDGTGGISGILRRANGEPSIRMWSRSTAETPNRVALEFQDAFNEFQQDSLSLVDVDDALKVGQEVSLTAPALGVPNFSQAARVVRFCLDKAVAGNTYVEFETTVRALGLKPGDVITLTYLKEGFDRQPFRIVSIAPGTNYRTAAITAQIHDDAWYDDHNGGDYTWPYARRQPAFGIGMPRPVAGKVWDQWGVPQLEIVERSEAGADGTSAIMLTAGFEPPRQPAASGLGIPVVSLAAGTESTGGTLAGDQTLYYAVTAGDAAGQESGVSFAVRVTIPAGTSTNTVTLGGLSFTSDATCFHVYRGTAPAQLLRIAAGQVIASEFTDTGIEAELVPPPDENYDHANLYWRLEQQPEYAATVVGERSIGNSTLAMPTNVYRGMTVRVTRGKGAGQERSITSNDATTLTTGTKWAVEPEDTSWFVIAESGWHFGAAGSAGPLEFEAPNRPGATVHVSARAANVYDRECPYELSPVTRWWITGAGALYDADVPGTPVFGLMTRHRGDAELIGVAFEDLENTRTISSGTLTLHYRNELAGPPACLLAAAIGAEAETITLTQAGGAAEGDLIQIDSEVLRVEETLGGGTSYAVTRGVQGSLAAAHAAGAPIHDLVSRTSVVPFARDFFGSPASGSYNYTAVLEDARIASAELFVTNARGNSAMATNCYTGTLDQGLRTLSGGHFVIQVEGYLAVETNAAPPLAAPSAHAVRDVFARVNDAPTGAPVELEVKQDGAAYCQLAIPAGATMSNVVDGAGLPPLEAGAQLALDIVSVPAATDEKPGRDLTVTIRV